MSTTLTLRAVKGTPLTNTEVDNNFTSLANNKLEVSSNLSDLADAPTARTNLGVYSVAEAQAYATSMAIALG